MTVAEKVTTSPAVDGLREEMTVVFVASCWTVWVKVEDVLPVKLASPL